MGPTVSATITGVRRDFAKSYHREEATD